MLENTSLAHYWHLDLYLGRLERQQQARGFVQYSVFAGYGHRVSMSTTKQDGGVQRFGGCFLPQSPHLTSQGKGRKGQLHLQAQSSRHAGLGGGMHRGTGTDAEARGRGSVQIGAGAARSRRLHRSGASELAPDVVRC